MCNLNFVAENYLQDLKRTTKIVDLIAPYLSHILINCFLSPPLLADFIFIALPSLAVTTHSLALPASNKPINVAFVLWRDMTFSKATQKKSK